MNYLLLDCRQRLNGDRELSIDSLIAFSLWKFLNGQEEMKIKLVEGNEFETAILVQMDEKFELIQSSEDKKKLPMLIIDNGNYKIIGLCSILRAICSQMKLSTLNGKLATQLLGFKENCLLSSAEVSLWVNYCERELIACVEALMHTKSDAIKFPKEIMMLEYEFSNPVRIHNVFKIVRETKKNQSIISDSAAKVDLEHKYCIGNLFSLSDFILYVQYKLIFMTVMNENEAKNNIPLIMNWFRNIECEFPNLKAIVTNLLANVTKKHVNFEEELPIVELNGKYFSLYNRQLSCQKAKKKKSKIFTNQDEIDKIMLKLKTLNLEIKSIPGSADDQNSVDDTFIEELLKRGELPIDRLERKKHQLKSLICEVVKIARNGDIIVDFCSGTGHLGILIAKLLPDCCVILLENKEEGQKRAKLKAKTLKLTNVIYYQCNLVTFTWMMQHNIRLL